MFTFLKNTLFRGLLILIPLVLTYVAFRELLVLLVEFATPIADLFPKEVFEHTKETEITAAVLVVASSFLLGSIAYSGPIRRAAHWLEQRTFNRLPAYRMMHSLVAAFMGMEEEDSFRPALLEENDAFIPVYVVEDRGFRHVVVMLPWTPTPFAGALKVVRKERVQFLPISLDAFSVYLTNFGLGLGDQLAKYTRIEEEAAAQTDPNRMHHLENIKVQPT